MAQPAPGPSTPRLPDTLVSDAEALLGDDVEWSGQHVVGDFSSRTAERVDVTACRVQSTSFTAVDIRRLRVSDALFVDCELSGATLHEADFSRVEFVQCRMLGLSVPAGRLRDVRFVECRLDGAEFRMSDCDQVQFDRCNLVGADFYAARLSRVHLFDSDLTGVEFSKAILKDGRLHGSRLESLRGASALRNVTIDSSQILPMALQVFSSVGIDVDDEREPPSAPEAAAGGSPRRARRRGPDR
jgi:uncharacterized protein YjbI with pentapeptide repeats